MLARGVRPSAISIVPARIFNNYDTTPRLIRRHVSTILYHWGDATTVKEIEAKIQHLNAHTSLDEEYKFRSSRRLFAQLDYCKLTIELQTLSMRHMQHFPNLRNLQCESNMQLLRNASALDAIFSRLEVLRWDVFALNFFAPQGDVSIAERLLRIPFFVGPLLANTFDSMMIRSPARTLKELMDRGMRLVHDLELPVANCCADKEA